MPLRAGRHAALILASMLVATSAMAQLPGVINYQGKLADAAGVAVPDGVRSLTFSLWTAESGGSQRWSEAHPAVGVRNGLFSARLGQTTPIPALEFLSPRFLQVQVGAEAPLARQPLSAAPYALAANIIADGGVDGAAIVDGSVNSTHVLDGSVTGSHVADGSLLADDLSYTVIMDCPLSGGIVSGGWTRVCEFELPPLPSPSRALVGATISCRLGCMSTNPGQRVDVEFALSSGFSSAPTPVLEQGLLSVDVPTASSMPESLTLTGVTSVSGQDWVSLWRRTTATGGCGTVIQNVESVKVWLIVLGRP